LQRAWRTNWSNWWMMVRCWESWTDACRSPPQLMWLFLLFLSVVCLWISSWTFSLKIFFTQISNKFHATQHGAAYVYPHLGWITGIENRK
jgi:hypothetical protein